MTEHSRICKQCDKPFTADRSNRVYCYECKPFGYKNQSPHKYTPEQHRWLEERSRRNMAQFYLDELLGIKEGRKIPKNTMHVLKQNDLVVSTNNGPGSRYILTGIGETLLGEVSP